MVVQKKENQWKDWLDKILVFNLFIVLVGAICFLTAILFASAGNHFLLNIFEKLWKPLFVPAITILISAALIDGLFNWWQRQGLLQGRDTET